MLGCISLGVSHSLLLLAITIALTGLDGHRFDRVEYARLPMGFLQVLYFPTDQKYPKV